MRGSSTPNRRRKVRQLIVYANVVAQLLGCASPQPSRHRPITEPNHGHVSIPAKQQPRQTSTSSPDDRADVVAPPANQNRAATRVKAAKPLTRKAKFQRALRRGAINSEDSAKEALKVTGRVAIIAALIAGVAGIWYLALKLDNDDDCDEVIAEDQP